MFSISAKKISGQGRARRWFFRHPR